MLAWGEVDRRLRADGYQPGSPQYEQTRQAYAAQGGQGGGAPQSPQQEAPVGTAQGSTSQQPEPEGWWTAAKEGAKGSLVGAAAGYKPTPGYEAHGPLQNLAYWGGQMAGSPMTYGMALAPEFFGPVGMALGFGGENLAASKMRGESNEQALEAGASGVGAGLAGGILGRLGFRAGTGVAKNFGEAAYRDFVENTPVGKWLYNLAVNRYGEGVGTRAVQAAGREVGLGGGFGYGGAAGANIAREGVPQSGEDVGRRVREIAGQGLGPAEQGAGMSLAILLARKLLTGRRGTPVGYGQRLRASPEELAGQAANKPTSIEARPQNEPGEQRMGAGQGAPKAGGEVTETPAGGDPNDPVVWQAPAVNGVPVQEVLSRAGAGRTDQGLVDSRTRYRCGLRVRASAGASAKRARRDGPRCGSRCAEAGANEHRCPRAGSHGGRTRSPRSRGGGRCCSRTRGRPDRGRPAHGDAAGGNDRGRPRARHPRERALYDYPGHGGAAAGDGLHA